MAEDEDVKVVKIHPYPFPIYFQREGKPVRAEVLKLAQKGAIIRVQDVFLKVGEEFPVEFEIPVHKASVQTAAKVMKTYDRALLQEKGVERLAELYFTHITQVQIRSIYKFLVAIKQVK
jgi:hypothetical protein